MLLLATALAWAGSTQISGHVYTTKADGSSVNANLYPGKTTVYLNGGPQNSTSNGLPSGTYYFQVTDPNGNMLLSADDQDCRIVTVGATNRIEGAAPAGPNCTTGAHANGATNTQNFSTGVQLCPAASNRANTLNSAAGVYDSSNWCDTTPNNGGEYKLWLTRTTDLDLTHCAGNHGFCDSRSKTDNFKIGPDRTTTPTSSTIVWPLGGHKFYDANADGIWNVDGNGNHTEPIIDGWQVRAVKSCQEDQVILARLLGGATLPVLDNDPLTGLLGTSYPPYGRQFQFTAYGTNYEPDGLIAPGAGGVTEDGFYQFRDLNVGGHYSSCEIIPQGPGSFLTGTSSLAGHNKWFATAGTESDNHWSPTDSADFGNLCTGAGGGLTLGFWSNTNGESVMAYGKNFSNKVAKSCNAQADGTAQMAASLAVLTGINLVDANGNYINPSTMGYCNFRKWLLGATSTNSAYMLSAQLAAMKLNVYFGYVSASSLIYAPGTNSANPAGFATVGDVMAEAIDSLSKNPYVVVGKLLNNNVSLKTYQTTVKDALDNANNNLGFVQSDPSKCGVPAYADQSTNSCIPSDAASGTTNTWQPIPENPAAPACSSPELIHYVCTLTNNTTDPACVAQP
jgi:hypothetical protein